MDLFRLFRLRKLKPIFSSGSDPYKITDSTSKLDLATILNSNDKILDEMQNNISTAYNSFLIAFADGVLIFVLATSLATGDISLAVYLLVFSFWTVVAIILISVLRVIWHTTVRMTRYIRNIEKYLSKKHLGVTKNYLISNFFSFLRSTGQRVDNIPVNGNVVVFIILTSFLLFIPIGIIAWGWTSAFIKNFLSPVL